MRCDCCFLGGNATLYGLLIIKCVWKQNPDIITSASKKRIIRLNASLIKWKWLLLFKHLFVQFFWQIDKPMISKRTRRRKNMFAIGSDLFPSRFHVIKNLEKGRKSNIVACNFTFWLGLFTKYRGNGYDTNDFCNLREQNALQSLHGRCVHPKLQFDLWESCGMPLHDVVL